MTGHNIQPLLNKQYTKAQSARGVYIYDDAGKAYLDGSSGAITCSLGHSHPVLIDQMHRNLDGLQYVYRSQFGSHQADALAEKLCEISPQQHYQYSFFVNSGSEAIETAMKVAMQYWQELKQPEKTIFIARRKSYHGITKGALSVSGHLLRRKIFERTLDQFPTLKADLENDNLEIQTKELIQIIDEIGSNRIAAFVAEPIVGAAGTAISPPPGYYEAFRKICQEHNMLFIADEVMTGLGRSGAWFGLNHWNSVADLAAVGKSLGAGYAPIAATLVTDSVLAPIKKGSGLIMSGHTYSGHPFSCATALEVIRIIHEEQLIQRVNTCNKYLMKRLVELQKKYAIIETVRGKGLLLGMELNGKIKGSQAKLIERCFDNGLLIYPSVGGRDGTDENGILIAPPFIISNKEMDELLQKLALSLEQIDKIN